jgi:hypothetical protein
VARNVSESDAPQAQGCKIFHLSRLHNPQTCVVRAAAAESLALEALIARAVAPLWRVFEKIMNIRRHSLLVSLTLRERHFRGKITAEGQTRVRELVREVVVLRKREEGRGGSPEPPADN